MGKIPNNYIFKKYIYINMWTNIGKSLFINDKNYFLIIFFLTY